MVITVQCFKSVVNSSQSHDFDEHAGPPLFVDTALNKKSERPSLSEAKTQTSRERIQLPSEHTHTHTHITSKGQQSCTAVTTFVRSCFKQINSLTQQIRGLWIYLRIKLSFRGNALCASFVKSMRFLEASKQKHMKASWEVLSTCAELINGLLSSADRSFLDLLTSAERHCVCYPGSFYLSKYL